MTEKTREVQEAFKALFKKLDFEFHVEREPVPRANGRDPVACTIGVGLYFQIYRGDPDESLAFHVGVSEHGITVQIGVPKPKHFHEPEALSQALDYTEGQLSTVTI